MALYLVNGWVGLVYEEAKKLKSSSSTYFALINSKKGKFFAKALLPFFISISNSSSYQSFARLCMNCNSYMNVPSVVKRKKKISPKIKEEPKQMRK